MIARLFRLIAATALVLPATGWTCSLPATYRTPTNFELVERADLIVIAQVDSGAEGSVVANESSDRFEPVVRIGPMQVLKGVLPKAPLTLEGIVSMPEGHAFESAPTPLTSAHYSTRAGGCRRYYFAKGSLVLAMFEKDGDSFRPIPDAFSRALEDIESYDSLWVRTVRRYIDVQRGASGGALRAAAIGERRKLQALTTDMEAQAVAADLDAWLKPKENVRQWTVGWVYDDDVDRVTLRARGSKARPDWVSLSCRRHGTALELAFDEPASRPAPALTIGDRSFAADRGLIGFSPELGRLLHQSAGPFAVSVAGKPRYRGDASDKFQKFAMRCETLLDP